MLTRPVPFDSSSHPEYPLERVCTYPSEPFQLTFARNARQHFVMREDVEVVASHGGLTIRAETEDAIDAALALLKDLYGPRLTIGPPTVLYHQGASLEQPWMGLRVRCGIHDLAAVNADLIDRAAMLISCRLDGNQWHIEARAPLALLLGYRADLDRMTAGAARHSMWLSHYAPLPPAPPDRAA
jgi:translation elongation factor EF-G